MDRKEREHESRAPRDAPRGAQASSKATDLLSQGDRLYAAGLFQRAVHVWTRILFLDRRNQEARSRIKRAKEALAERQRQLDSRVAEAARLLSAGDVDGASRSLRAVLALDARNAEALRLSEEIAAAAPRPSGRQDAPSGALETGSPSSRGLLLRVSRRRSSTKITHSAVASRLKMVAFILTVCLIFAAAALYLHANWDSIVSDGVTGSASVTTSPGSEWAAPEPPRLAELRYYNGARLFERGRYREALAQLGRVDRGSSVAADARNLILRIEERLLRAAPDLEEDAGAAAEMR